MSKSLASYLRVDQKGVITRRLKNGGRDLKDQRGLGLCAAADALKVREARELFTKDELAALDGLLGDDGL